MGGVPADERDAIDAFVRRHGEDSFLRLYRPHTPYLLRLALRLLGGRNAEAEDAVQETWLRATRKLATFRGEATLRTWLSAILINCCREIRRRSLFEELDQDLESGERPRCETGVDLERAIEALPEGYRDVLVLHDLYGHTHAEIAALLGIEPGTSKSQLSRARAALRRRWPGPETVNAVQEASR